MGEKRPLKHVSNSFVLKFTRNQHASQSETQYQRLHSFHLSVHKTSSIRQTWWVPSMLKQKASHLRTLSLKDVFLIKFINLTDQPSVLLLPQGVMYLAFTIFVELLS
jgi:hypothetical protein